MIAWANILILVAYLIVGFLFNLKFLFYFEHPDDSKFNQGLIAKIVALAGLELIWLTLSLPLIDAFNARHDNGFDMQFCWNLVSLLIIVYTLFPLPLAIFYYEADSNEKTSKMSSMVQALRNAGIALFIALILILILYFSLRTLTPCPKGVTHCISTISIQYFPLALFTFFGWFTVIINLGIGFTATPLMLCLAFIRRTKPISRDEYNEKKKIIHKEILRIKAIGEELRDRDTEISAITSKMTRWSMRRAFNSDMKKFQQSMHLLMQDFNNLNISMKLRGENPFYSYLKLFFGIISIIISLCWCVHITLRVLIPQVIKSNKMPFKFLDQAMLFITGADAFILDFMLYCILMSYLIICVASGFYTICVKFVLFKIRPFIPNATHMNGFLINILLINLGILPLLYLFYICFESYCASTEMAVIYGDIFNRIPLFKAFFKNRLFIWLLMITAIIAFAYSISHTREKKALTVKEKKKSHLFFWKTKEAPKEDEANVNNVIDTEFENIAGKFDRTAGLIAKIGIL